ncbi:hypothetical protein [Cohnella hashimotonis]|uniref:Peptidase C14 n=1 Tax=Cohnella hashimotonis TaxID=2826895 RepID=A0ABT6TGG9_9BACL|nr:hypothetical protein [Cohnella hashimotonis]MDI4645932.1 hypothetical protein [Cohnella hashimotonis]
MEGCKRQVENVAALKLLQPGELEVGETIWVRGYATAGDGGAKAAMWKPGCETPDDGGLVHAPAGGGKGRWMVLHGGVGRFRYFGVFGADIAADDALEAMLADPSIRRIEADCDLNFMRRHRIGRSFIDLDFNGFTVTTAGIEPAPPNDPFAAVFFFSGEETGDVQRVVLSASLAELEERFEVADAGAFEVGDWWIVRCDRRSGGAERELEKLVKVTEVTDRTHVRLQYKNGWALEAGREIEYRRVKPVVQANVRNMKFVANGATEATGSHPLAYEYAVECDAVGIDATGTYWPVVMRRYNTFYVTERCQLLNPAEVVVGGTGYLTQQIYCLYGHVRDCLTSNGRHLNDFTGSAYCHVENCHADGDDLGAFVTHGQYEHDLTYVGNSGLMSFANSGPTWGESAKRITVKQHVASWFLAFRKVTDLTLEDVHVFARAGVENSHNTGSFWLNADGVQMKNCTAEKMVKFKQASARSDRPVVVENCAFALTAGRRVSQEEVASELTFRECRFTAADGNAFAGSGSVRFQDCRLEGAGPDALPIRFAGSELVFRGGEISNSGFRLIGGEVRLEVGSGATIIGSNGEKAFFSRSKEAGPGAASWSFDGAISLAADRTTAHFSIEDGGAVRDCFVRNSSFKGGRFAVSEGAFGAESCMLYTSNVERGVDRSALPPESASIRHREGNVILPACT